MNQETFKAQIQATNITYRNQHILVLHQNEPYVYLGIHLENGKYKHTQQQQKLINQCNQLVKCPIIIRQKISM